MSGQPVVLQVVILRDGLLVGTEVFVPGSYSVGSAPLSDLKLDDPTIQQQQAVLYFQNGKAAIQDMGGGVYVNGIKVTACEIRSMDEVVVGPFVLKCRIVAQRPASPAMSPEVAALLGGAPPRPSAPSLSAAPPGASWPAMPAVAHAANLVALPAPELHPTPAPVAKPQGTVASARRIAQQAQKVPLPAPKRPKEPTTDEHLLELEREPGTMQEMVHQDDRPTFVPGSVGSEPAPRAQKPRGNGVHVREGQMPTATPGEGRPAAGPSLAKAARPPTAQQKAQAPEKEKAKAKEKAKPAAPAKAPKVSTAGMTAGGSGRTRLRLYYELHWRGMRHGAVSFGAESARKGKPILGTSAMGPEFPYWGFEGVPQGKFPIAQVRGDSYRLFVPSTAKIERRQGTDFQQVNAGELDRDGDRLYMTLSAGGQARFSAGGMTLYATVAPPAEKVKVNPLKGLPWVLIALLVLISSGGIAVLVMMPKASEAPDFTAKGLDPVAVRLAIQPKEKKEKAKEKLEKIRKKKDDAVVENKPEKKTKPTKEPVQVAPPPAETKALKQLAKLAAAGPAMGDMLAAVDKLGNGPGAKNAKTGFHLSGLVGKSPIANAGLGTFGLGGGGKGGVGTLGAEILRGRGGGGIGAMGAGGIGKGTVGGMVTHATSRSVGVPQGNIDREAVAKTINAHLQEVRGCYERALLKDPGLAGKVVLEWTIGTTGSVTAAKTKSSTLKNASVEGCILSALKTWQFPQPRGGVVIISYPFLFNSVGF
ncbi:MAG TPA: AgmX/PglI C-terminal domain-containing protein [Myxococcaceae bacterium]|nr:AgmX/PglI C-terminal domain-containing protein [Myxococcaceae bacterium]